MRRFWGLLIGLAFLTVGFASPVYADVGTCPISADFITEPEIIETLVPLGGLELKSTTKRSFVTGAILSIECTEMALETVYPGATDAEILRNYVRFWSIQPVENSNEGISEDTYPRAHFIITGTKSIQGIEVTYSYRLFRFASSFAMVVIGMPSDTQDRSDSEKFLNSLRITEPVSDFSDQEKMEGRKNHMASCLPAVRADNERRQLGLTDLEITFFCSCTGVKYFDEFTRAELSSMASKNDAALAERREQVQVECFQEAIK